MSELLHYPSQRGKIVLLVCLTEEILCQHKGYFGMSFAEAKAAGKLVFGQLPVLDADGVLIAQSGSHNRLVAALVGEKKKDFYPSDPVKLAVADMLHETHQACASTSLFE